MMKALSSYSQFQVSPGLSHIFQRTRLFFLCWCRPPSQCGCPEWQLGLTDALVVVFLWAHQCLCRKCSVPKFPGLPLTVLVGLPGFHMVVGEWHFLALLLLVDLHSILSVAVGFAWVSYTIQIPWWYRVQEMLLLFSCVVVESVHQDKQPWDSSSLHTRKLWLSHGELIKAWWQIPLELLPDPNLLKTSLGFAYQCFHLSQREQVRCYKGLREFRVHNQ